MRKFEIVMSVMTRSTRR